MHPDDLNMGVIQIYYKIMPFKHMHDRFTLLDSLEYPQTTNNIVVKATHCRMGAGNPV